MRIRYPFLCAYWFAMLWVPVLLQGQGNRSKAPFRWEAANVYFLLTDRFHNGDNRNDQQAYRNMPTGTLRGFMGGDLAGIRQKLREGYFTRLGINVLWFTPVFEQTKGVVDEGTGNTYAYHGYWPRDFTALDPNFGTFEELKQVVALAHEQGIRIMMDVVLNHIGPTTAMDAPWPEAWVRTAPRCTYDSYVNTTACTLVENLPDVKTESDAAVTLPPYLAGKWKQEGRYEQEMQELDAFFARTGYPRAPRYFIIKWLMDYVQELGIDGFRFDTVKHLEETVFDDVKKEGIYALNLWKTKNAATKLDDTPFFLLGEVYNYNASNKRIFDFGDKRVDYFAHGFNSLINFEFSSKARENSYEALFASYSQILQSPEMQGYAVLNYLASHDDRNCFDTERKKPFEAANKLLLCPGAAQVYYGDESMRPLEVAGANGDANLRAYMNWEDISNNRTIQGFSVKEVHNYWSVLGRFRRDHPAVGAGRHQQIADAPFYVFGRQYQAAGITDKVVVALDVPAGRQQIPVGDVFANGTRLRDAFTGKKYTVKQSRITVKQHGKAVLLAQL